MKKGKYEGIPFTEIMQGYFMHKTEGPIQVVMYYSGHPNGDTDAAPGRWYKYQTCENGNTFGYCQAGDLIERITEPKDSWGPKWLQSWKKGVGTFKD